jgi:hypothetical protein
MDGGGLVYMAKKTVLFVGVINLGRPSGGSWGRQGKKTSQGRFRNQTTSAFVVTRRGSVMGKWSRILQLAYNATVP